MFFTGAPLFFPFSVWNYHRTVWRWNILTYRPGGRLSGWQAVHWKIRYCVWCNMCFLTQQHLFPPPPPPPPHVLLLGCAKQKHFGKMLRHGLAMESDVGGGKACSFQRIQHLLLNTWTDSNMSPISKNSTCCLLWMCQTYHFWPDYGSPSTTNKGIRADFPGE